MALVYTAHAAPMQMSFYNGAQFPAEFQGDAFISLRGSWNRKPASSYEVARIHFRNGSAVSIKPFVTGFVSPQGESGRPMGNAIAKDGSLLFTDDRNGVIYRVSYTGQTSGRAHEVSTPAEAMLTDGCTAGPVYVSAFESTKKFRKFVNDISWETEVWIADQPDHIIHFDGERFLGPYDVFPSSD